MPVRDIFTAIRDCPALAFTRGQIFAGAWSAFFDNWPKGLKQARIYGHLNLAGGTLQRHPTIAEDHTEDAAASRPTLDVNKPAVTPVRSAKPFAEWCNARG